MSNTARIALLGVGFTMLGIGLPSSSGAAETASLPRGTVCFANSLRNTEQVPIACKGLGKFTTIAELYERGYRVVSSGVMPESGNSTVFLIVEERR